MKTTLEFNDDETKLALQSLHGPEAFSTLEYIDQTFRNYLKHGDERFTDVNELIDYVRNEISDVMDKVRE